MVRKRPDWSRPLPEPLQILDENEKPIVTLKTLGDVRKMLLGLPEPYQLKTTWGHVAVMLDEAARGGDIMDVVVPLRMVLYGRHCVPAEIACSMSATSRQVRRRQVRTAKAKMCDGSHFAPPSPAVWSAQDVDGGGLSWLQL
jgi:hypothetical protein